MKTKLLKRIMSLALVVLMVVSTMTISAVSTSAETGTSQYKFDFQTAGSDGTSKDTISIKVNGDKGSTSWHDVGKVAKNKTGSASFSDSIDVGTITSITVKNSGSDGWFPEIIKVTKGEITATIYGGVWDDDKKEVELSVKDKGIKLNVKTSSALFSGTDEDVYVRLYFDDTTTANKSDEYTTTFNLSEIHPKLNAFEMKDDATFYLKVPYICGKLKKVSFFLKETYGYVDYNIPQNHSSNGVNIKVLEKNSFKYEPSNMDDWKLDSFEINYDNVTYSAKINSWAQENGQIDKFYTRYNNSYVDVEVNFSLKAYF